MLMASGRRIDPDAPKPDAVWMGDIANHLSKICILNGGTYCFFSEAQHAAILADEMAKITDAAGALYGLLHNAHLAVKTETDTQRQAVMASIFDALDLEWPMPQTVSRALQQAHPRVLLGEIEQLTTGRVDDAKTMRGEGIVPVRFVIKALAWDRAKDRYIEKLRGYAVAANLRPVTALEGIL